MLRCQLEFGKAVGCFIIIYPLYQNSMAGLGQDLETFSDDNYN